MPRPRHAMRRIREVLRLALGEGLSARQIKQSLGMPRVTVARYVERARMAGMTCRNPIGQGTLLRVACSPINM